MKGAEEISPKARPQFTRKKQSRYSLLVPSKKPKKQCDENDKGDKYYKRRNGHLGIEEERKYEGTNPGAEGSMLKNALKGTGGNYDDNSSNKQEIIDVEDLPTHSHRPEAISHGEITKRDDTPVTEADEVPMQPSDNTGPSTHSATFGSLVDVGKDPIWPYRLTDSSLASTVTVMQPNHGTTEAKSEETLTVDLDQGQKEKGEEIPGKMISETITVTPAYTSQKTFLEKEAHVMLI